MVTGSIGLPEYSTSETLQMVQLTMISTAHTLVYNTALQF